MMITIDSRRDKNRNRKKEKSNDEDLITEELTCFQNYNVRFYFK